MRGRAPDDPDTTYISVVGNTHAMLVTGAQINGRFMPQRPCLGNEFSDHNRRQPGDPVLRHDQLTRP
ncbi:hypothetical protein ACWDR3_30585, partial [Streptomyces sp. NPDC001002]